MTTTRPRRLADLGPSLGPKGRFLLRHRDQVLAVAAQHEATNVRVFGSVARGEDTKDSDIDILVDLEDPSLLDIIGVGLDIGDVLDPEKADVTVPQMLKPYIREEALRQAVAL